MGERELYVNSRMAKLWAREEAEKRKLLTIVEDESRDHEEHQEEEKKGEIRSL